MLTIKKNILTKLEERGLWPNEATAVFQRLHDLPENKVTEGRWDHPMEDYPLILTGSLWASAKDQAVAYIDEVKPMHWARPMFVD